MPSTREFFERNVGRCNDAQSLGDRFELCSRYDDVEFALPETGVNAISDASQACDRAVQHRRRKWAIFASMVISGWALLEAASILAIWMFFLALGGLCPYSARRARLVLFEVSRRACSLNSEEENETRWQNQ